jgi:hypothetical protein
VAAVRDMSVRNVTKVMVTTPRMPTPVSYSAQYFSRKTRTAEPIASNRRSIPLPF